MTPAQWKILRTIHAHGELAVGSIHPRTLEVLRLSGWIEDCARMYFGPRSHRVKLTVEGRTMLERHRPRRAPLSNTVAEEG